jgi:hypothetical protein
MAKRTITLKRQTSGRTDKGDPFTQYFAGEEYEEEFRNLNDVQKLNHQAGVMEKLNNALAICHTEVARLKNSIKGGRRKTRRR